MPYPIKYIENNLVWNNEGECFAYYELIPFNYSFLSLEQKDAVHDAFRQLIAQNRDGKIHALQISTESSIRAAQERSKKSVTGRLKEIACAEIDEQTENLVASLGDTQVDYRFFLYKGFLPPMFYNFFVNSRTVSVSFIKNFSHRKNSFNILE